MENLLFTEWKTQISRAEKEAAKTSSKSNEIIQHLCDQLFKIGLLEENTSDMFSMIKEVESRWIQQEDQKEEMIKKIDKFDQENSLNFLIKLYNQHQTL